MAGCTSRKGSRLGKKSSRKTMILSNGGIASATSTCTLTSYDSTHSDTDSDMSHGPHIITSKWNT